MVASSPLGTSFDVSTSIGMYANMPEWEGDREVEREGDGWGTRERGRTDIKELCVCARTHTCVQVCRRKEQRGDFTPCCKYSISSCVYISSRPPCFHARIASTRQYF